MSDVRNGSLSQPPTLTGTLSYPEPLRGELADPDELNGTLDGKLIRGYSAYAIAVELGFEGTVEEWIASLKGEKGDRGNPGYTPQKGVDYFDGYSPVRGTDYWTEADKRAVIDQVLEELPAAEEVSF